MDHCEPELNFCKNSLYGSPLPDCIWIHQVVWWVPCYNFSVYTKMAITKIAYFLPFHVSGPLFEWFYFRSSHGYHIICNFMKTGKLVKSLMVKADSYWYAVDLAFLWSMESRVCVNDIFQTFLKHQLGSL